MREETVIAVMDSHFLMEACSVVEKSTRAVEEATKKTADYHFPPQEDRMQESILLCKWRRPVQPLQSMTKKTSIYFCIN